MAQDVIFMDSFDHYSSEGQSGAYDKWTNYTNAFTSTTPPIVNDRYVNSGEIHYHLASTYTAFYAGFHYYTDGTGDFISIGRYTSSFDHYLRLGYNVITGILSLTASSNISSSTYTYNGLSSLNWYHIGFRIESFGATSCTVKIYINEVEVINQTISYSTLANPTLDHIQVKHKMDNFYISGGTTRGDYRIGVLRPNGDTADKDFLRSAGTDNYALLDEDLVDGATTYVYTTTVGDKDIYDMQNVSADIDTIIAVQALVAHRKTEAGTVTNRIVWKPTTVEYYSANFNPSLNNWLYMIECRNANPDTSTDWTKAEVDAMKMGHERVA